MKTVRVENNKVVVECDGARVSHSLATIQKCISKLEEDLEMWRNYERLLTKRVADGFSAWGGDDDQGDGIGFAEVHGW